jgi:hypothetical protein
MIAGTVQSRRFHSFDWKIEGVKKISDNITDGMEGLGGVLSVAFEAVFQRVPDCG